MIVGLSELKNPENDKIISGKRIFEILKAACSRDRARCALYLTVNIFQKSSLADREYQFASFTPV